MKNLSYTQEFYLCAVNKKGRASLESECALFAGAMMELLGHGYVKPDENGCIISAEPLGDAHLYLKPVYDFIISQKKPKPLADLAPEWMVSFKKKTPSKELLAAIGSSLAEANHATELSGRLSGNFVPKPEAVKPIIEKIRAELLEDGNIADEIVCLVAMLEISGIIGNYFSKVEANELKKRLGEIKDSEAFSTLRDALDNVIATVIAAIV